MKNKPLEMTLLFDFYGDILTDKQHELFDLYYNEDLSLAEIAENAGISRQAVRDGVLRAEHTLRGMEEKLGLVARYGETEEKAEALSHQVQALQQLNETRLRDEQLGDLLAALARQIALLS